MLKLATVQFWRFPDRLSGVSRGLPAGHPPHKSGCLPNRVPAGKPIPTTSAVLPSFEPLVSIVVPVRNEADNIAPLIEEITTALDGRWAYEIIYINDGSTDDTNKLGAIGDLHLVLTREQVDDDVIVVNKPAGMVVHPAAGHAEAQPGQVSCLVDLVGVKPRETGHRQDRACFTIEDDHGPRPAA